MSSASQPGTGAASIREEETRFQPDTRSIRWKIHFRSPPGEVYRTLATSEGRSRFWAESAEEENGVIHFIVPGDLKCEGRILEQISEKRFVAEYFGWIVEFELRPDAAGSGTDLQMTCTDFPLEARLEITAGWVSVLMNMKAAVDFNVDLRNHDAERSWWQGYADN